jgi:hypothetical protein
VFLTFLRQEAEFAKEEIIETLIDRRGLQVNRLHRIALLRTADKTEIEKTNSHQNSHQTFLPLGSREAKSM